MSETADSSLEIRPAGSLHTIAIPADPSSPRRTETAERLDRTERTILPLSETPVRLHAWEVVVVVDHPGLGVQWDGGQLQASGAADGPALVASAPRCLHVHASQPGLGPFAPPAPAHARLAAALPAAASPWLSLEMTAAGLAALDDALIRIREIYADAL